MTYIIIVIALILAAAWLDKQRGFGPEDETIPKGPALIGLGLCNAFFIVDHSAALAVMAAQAAIITVAVTIAYNWPGFGEPIGHALTGRGGVMASDGTTYKRWQIGKTLKENPWLALAFYGAVFFPVGILLVSAITGAIAHFVGVAGVKTTWVFGAAIKLALAHAIAWPGACAVVRHVLKMPIKTTKQSGAAWGMQEYLRGAISMIVLAVIFSIA
jgi:hypothetical protein